MTWGNKPRFENHISSGYVAGLQVVIWSHISEAFSEIIRQEVLLILSMQDWDFSHLEPIGSKVFSVQFSSARQLCLTLCDPWTAACQASLFITNSRSLLKLMSIKLVMPSNNLTLCGSLLFLPLIFPSIRVFFNESVLHIKWPKYLSLSLSFSPSNEYSGLISVRMDWLDFLEVQWTLMSLLWHHSSKASILWCSAFFIVQLSHPYITTGKTIALTRWTFVGKVMSLHFNMLSRLVF